MLRINIDRRATEKQQLATIQAEHEAALARHQQFIDRLLQDKDALAQQCQQIMDKASNTDSQIRQKLDRQKEEFTLELKRQKEMWAAAEKVLRSILQPYPDVSGTP